MIRTWCVHFMIVILLVLISKMVVAQTSKIPGDKIVIGEDFDDIQTVNINYKGMPSGYNAKGQFVPREWCMGYLMGELMLSVKSPQLKNELQVFSDNFGLSVVELGGSRDDQDVIELGDKLEVNYVSASYPTDDTSIKVIDYDYDGTKELIVREPCGFRYGNNFNAFEFSSHDQTKSTVEKSVTFTGESEFNPVKRTLTVWLSGGACAGTSLHYASDEDTYLITKKIEYNEVNPLTGASGCYEVQYVRDKHGEFHIDSITTITSE